MPPCVERRLRTAHRGTSVQSDGPLGRRHESGTKGTVLPVHTMQAIPGSKHLAGREGAGESVTSLGAASDLLSLDSKTDAEVRGFLFDH